MVLVQLCGNNSGKAPYRFHMAMLPCPSQVNKWLSTKFGVEELDWSPQIRTSTPSNTFVLAEVDTRLYPFIIWHLRNI